MATNKLSFSYDDELKGYVSSAITASDDGAVTITLRTTTDNDSYRVWAQHSINGTDWQYCGYSDFTGHVEVTVDGLRANVQMVRFIVFGRDSVIENAEWV